MRVESFKVVERNMAIWVWLGDDAPNMDIIPDISFIEEAPEHGRIFGYMPTKANYQLLTDNILDLSHADYLHPTTLGGMMTNSNFTCSQDGESIILQWDSSDQAVPGAFAPDIPPPQRGDFSIQVRWSAPATMKLQVAAKPHSKSNFNPDDYSPTLHNMTPETATSTHYFFCATRPRNTPSPEVMAVIKEATEKAFFDEDKPMLEAQQERVGNSDFWALKPRMLPIDEGAVRVRRKLDALIKEEKERRPEPV
jgi:vanillate O-demethylase monooxygenase subunit